MFERWLLVDALEAYEDWARREAREQYRHSLLVYAALAPHAKKRLHPPTVPAILKEPSVG